MGHLNRIGGMRVVRLLMGLLCVLALAASARADEIYTYHGNQLATSGSYPCFGACALSGSLTLAQALPANQVTTVQFPAVLSWSFTDGSGVAWTNSNSNPNAFLGSFTTDISGQIVRWTLNGGTATVGSNTYQWYSSKQLGCGILLVCDDYSKILGTNALAQTFAPGSWTMTATSTVPEPSSLLLLIIGIVSLAMVRRRLLA